MLAKENGKNGGDSRRRSLVALLRGYFASPVIATLGEVGIAEKMLEGDFSATSLDVKGDKEILTALFRYLHSSAWWLKAPQTNMDLTQEGRTAIARNGAFSLLMSYADYFNQLPDLLAGAEIRPSVNRLRNVRGSGQLHGKKFFPSAFSLFSSAAPAAIIGIGCGDGCFLENARNLWPNLAVFGVDLSETAVETTKKRLATSTDTASLAVTANGDDVAIWSQAVPRAIHDSPRLIISLWFVAHEFSKGSPERVKAFFSALRQAFPSAEVVLGEINKISPAVLRKTMLCQSCLSFFSSWGHLTKRNFMYAKPAATLQRVLTRREGGCMRSRRFPFTPTGGRDGFDLFCERFEINFSLFELGDKADEIGQIPS